MNINSCSSPCSSVKRLTSSLGFVTLLLLVDYLAQDYEFHCKLLCGLRGDFVAIASRAWMFFRTYFFVASSGMSVVGTCSNCLFSILQ